MWYSSGCCRVRSVFIGLKCCDIIVYASVCCVCVCVCACVCFLWWLKHLTTTLQITTLIFNVLSNPMILDSKTIHCSVIRKAMKTCQRQRCCHRKTRFVFDKSRVLRSFTFILFFVLILLFSHTTDLVLSETIWNNDIQRSFEAQTYSSHRLYNWHWRVPPIISQSIYSPSHLWFHN